ncbi:MAG: response regulator transcription factor [Bacteroidetes bacterium]|nr:response regulator transcription factor [Bacteroidota bacterium]
MIRIGIVDDKRNNRIILADKLRRNNLFDIRLEAANGEQFLHKMMELKFDERPEIVLMDLEMPVMDGIVTIAAGSSLYPGTRYVVLTIFDDDDRIFNAIKAGACGYLLKEESGDIIADILMNLWKNGAGPISPSIAYKILQMIQNPPPAKPLSGAQKSENLFQLSEREKEILRFLCQGLEYKEIAEKLSISANTVKKHVINIYDKLHVNNKARALHIAYTKNLL